MNYRKHTRVNMNTNYKRNNNNNYNNNNNNNNNNNDNNNTIINPIIESVYQFGYGPLVDRPIVVDLPEVEGTRDFPPLPALFRVGPQQQVDVVINWKVFSSPYGIETMYNSMTSKEDNKTILPILPQGAVVLSKGQRQVRSERFDELNLPMGAPITTSFPANEAINGLRYFIWYNVRATNLNDDYEYYYNRWIPAGNLWPNQNIGYEYRLQLIDDPTADPDFADVRVIPACKFPAFSYTRIDNLISYNKWLQQGKTPTFTVTNS